MNPQREMAVRPGTPADFAAVAGLIVAGCRRPETHCLTSWDDQTELEVDEHLQGLHEAGELVLVVVDPSPGSDRPLAGGDGRGDRRGAGSRVGSGATCRAGGVDGHGPGAPRSPGRPPARRNPAVRCLSEPRSSGGNRSLPGAGIRAGGSRLTSIDSWPRGIVSGDDLPALQASQHPAFSSLHRALFPDAPYSASGILDRLGPEHHVLVSGPEEKIAGYVHLSVHEGGDQGTVEYLGVREDARRQGWGQRLLVAGLRWLVHTAGVVTVSLVVQDQRVGARSLYERVGFERAYTGLSLRKRR